MGLPQYFLSFSLASNSQVMAKLVKLRMPFLLLLLIPPPPPPKKKKKEEEEEKGVGHIHVHDSNVSVLNNRITGIRFRAWQLLLKGKGY